MECGDMDGNVESHTKWRKKNGNIITLGFDNICLFFTMNPTTYLEYFKRLPEKDPLKICRICIQETKNMIASNDPEWSEIHSSYENITKLKVFIAII